MARNSREKSRIWGAAKYWARRRRRTRGFIRHQRQGAAADVRFRPDNNLCLVRAEFVPSNIGRPGLMLTCFGRTIVRRFARLRGTRKIANRHADTPGKRIDCGGVRYDTDDLDEVCVWYTAAQRLFVPAMG